MKRPITKTDIILSCVSLALCIAFLCFSIKKVVVDNADWKGGIWVFSILTLYLSILIVLGVKYLKKNGK